MYAFHEGFNARHWDLQFCKFVYGVFGYGSSYSACDGNKGVGFPSIILYGVN